jgi:ribosomal protein S18 acetylase RimI-like enzyme
MVKSKFDIVSWGPDRLRIGPWRGDPEVAYLAPVNGRTATVGTVDRCLSIVGDKGYRRVLTAALTRAEQQPFLERGFVPHEWLYLLRHDLADLEPMTEHRLRRALPFDHARVLEIDAQAFDAFWRFDRDGLADARRATPTSRFRVADDGGLVGYAITGRATTQGYLQRLAVDPPHHHRGIGRALVLDALWWAKRRGATSMLVNTQESNVAARSLYERLGFVAEHDGLAVLEHTLDGWSP